MILILGGTSTTHEVISELTDEYIISVATEYGYQAFGLKYPGRVISVRFTPESLGAFIQEKNITEIIDSTHPYAQEISRTARKAAETAGIRYVSRIRETGKPEESEHVQICSSYEEAYEYIISHGYKSVLITTGANNIHKFSGLSETAYVRVLPFEKSIKACTDAGFHYSRIIAMQGPFSEDFNTALMRELKTDCLITKNSGSGSGFDAKLRSCIDIGAKAVIISPPESESR